MRSSVVHIRIVRTVAICAAHAGVSHIIYYVIVVHIYGSREPYYALELTSSLSLSALIYALFRASMCFFAHLCAPLRISALLCAPLRSPALLYVLNRTTLYTYTVLRDFVWTLCVS